jgi:NAD(P)-dependent dehydrogenase (short-subunit alcohol dehydrogenase family)
MNDFDLTGKKALVTGASSGLGAHFARLLARRGAEVIAAARRVDALEELAGSIRATGGQCLAVALDVTNSASIAAIKPQMAGLDILINNAGLVRPAPPLKITEENWDTTIDTNLKGMFLMAQAAAQAMQEAGKGGSIVNIASILGLRQGSGVLPYAVSKAGAIQLTKQLAMELARFDIKVNALAPGYLDTDLNGGFWDTEPGKAMIARIPQRRLGQLEELDVPLLLLASNVSPYMTGSVLTVDGGHLLNSL